MIQNNLQYLLKHPDISLEAPASNDYIEVNDAATGETLAWVKTYDRAGVEAAINRSAKRKLLGKSKLPWLVLMCYWHGTTSCLSTKKT